MITALFTPRNLRVQVIDIINPQSVLIDTLDGSTPFVQDVARFDPEQHEGYLNASWDWVPQDQLSEFKVVN